MLTETWVLLAVPVVTSMLAMWVGAGIKPVKEVIEYMRCQAWRTTDGRIKAIFNGIDIDLSNYPEGFEVLRPLQEVPPSELNYRFWDVKPQATPSATPTSTSTATSRRTQTPRARPREREPRGRARAPDRGCRCNIC